MTVSTPTQMSEAITQTVHETLTLAHNQNSPFFVYVYVCVSMHICHCVSKYYYVGTLVAVPLLTITITDVSTM